MDRKWEDANIFRLHLGTPTPARCICCTTLAAATAGAGFGATLSVLVAEADFAAQTLSWDASLALGARVVEANFCELDTDEAGAGRGAANASGKRWRNRCMVLS